MNTEGIALGRAVARAHLAAGETIEFATAAAVRRSRGGLAVRLANFFGSRGGRERVVVLTQTRLLVVHPRASETAGTWLDLQLDRRGVSADPPARHGGHLEVGLRSGLGSVTLLFADDRTADATDLAGRLAGTPRG